MERQVPPRESMKRQLKELFFFFWYLEKFLRAISLEIHAAHFWKANAI